MARTIRDNRFIGAFVIGALNLLITIGTVENQHGKLTALLITDKIR